MDDQGLPQITDELPELSALPTQDIPTAVRESGLPQSTTLSPKLKPAAPRSNLLILGLGCVALVALPLGLLLRSQTPPQSQPAPTVSAASPSPVPQPAASSALLGHLPYAEAPTAELTPLSSGSGILLRKAAAKKLDEMLAAAAAEGVVLHVISGFRSKSEQDKLFFDVKAERGEAVTQRATVSAPPGYSEHHTGYAVDLGDSDAPSTDLQFGFEQTKAFKWLKENAAYYSFEMSFPKGNPMGVSYEPWHWRFVGDSQSLETFYRARVGTAPAVPSSSPSSEASPESDSVSNSDSKSAAPQN